MWLVATPWDTADTACASLPEILLDGTGYTEHAPGTGRGALVALRTTNTGVLVA